MELDDDRLRRRGVRLTLLREDLVDPELPGNKARKLKYNLVAAAEAGARTLLTFGGAYSNHLRATAAAGRRYGFATIGVVRGEEHLPLNGSLRYAQECGMELTYLDRTAYRAKASPEVLADLHRRWGDFHLIPEGGSNALAVKGCAELAAELPPDTDVVCCPVGTGGTLAGLAAGLRPGQRALGFAVLRGGEFLTGAVADLQEQAGMVTDNWSVNTDFHHGGYARTTPELTAFSAEFHARHGLRLDRIYVAKMMSGLFALTGAGHFAPGTALAAVITGADWAA